MQYEKSRFQSALTYAAKGLPVLACDSAQNRRYLCRSPFRYQAVWPTQATTDPATIAAWFPKLPFANIALPTGSESGIIAIGSKGAEGLETLEQWMTQHDWFPETLSLEAGPTRVLLYSAGALCVPSKVELGPGVAALGDGEHILLPPSQDANGDYCTWNDADDAIVAPPTWMVDLILASTEVAA